MHLRYVPWVGHAGVSPSLSDRSEVWTHHWALHRGGSEAGNIVGRRRGKASEGRGGGVAEEGAQTGITEERGDLHHCKLK